MKKIINDIYIKDLIEKFDDDEDDEKHSRKESFNTEL